MKYLNSKIIDTINRQLPDNRKSVNYLMDLLSISRESAYRRLKNQIPFTLEEVATIAHNLDFSIDELIEYKQNTRIFFDMPVNIIQNPSEIFKNTLEESIRIMETLLHSTSLNIIVVLNRIPLSFLPFKTLFKYEYCRYVQSVGGISLMTQFSEITISTEIEQFHKTQAYLFNHLDNITCIIDNTVFSKIIEEIKHYYRLKFFSYENLQILQKELLELLQFIETLVRTGQNSLGSQYHIYHSFFNLEANSILCEYDGGAVSQIWIYPEYPILIKNNHIIYNMQKRWVDSKIRNSVLITKSNSVWQSEVLRKAYEQISELTNENSL